MPSTCCSRGWWPPPSRTTCRIRWCWRRRGGSASRCSASTGSPRRSGSASGNCGAAFIEAVGYGPKTLDRVLRFRRLVSQAHAVSSGEVDLARLAADLGYADQAHMTRTRCRLTGMPTRPPRRLLEQPSSELGGAVQLAAEVRELALLGLVEDPERLAHPLGVGGEGMGDEVVAGLREATATARRSLSSRLRATKPRFSSVSSTSVAVALEAPRRRRIVRSSRRPPALVSSTSIVKPVAETPIRSRSAARRRVRFACARTSASRARCASGSMGRRGVASSVTGDQVMGRGGRSDPIRCVDQA